MRDRKYFAPVFAFLTLAAAGFLYAQSLTIKVAEFDKKEQAEDLCGYLLSRGYPAYVCYENVCEVRSGPYETLDAADVHREKMIMEDKLAPAIIDETASEQQSGEYVAGRDVADGEIALHESETAKRIIQDSIDLFGHPYKYGGQVVGKGIDCSYYVQRIFRGLNVRLPRTAAEQFKVGIKLAPGDLKIGDLVFFEKTYYRRGNKRKIPFTRINHVGIYIGGGEFIHATVNVKKVTISKLSEPYYAKRFAGGRRVL